MGISLGLVGLGSFGRAFADLFMSHPLVDRIGLCDLEPERIAVYAQKPSWQAKFDPRDAYTSLDEICGAKLTAITSQLETSFEEQLRLVFKEELICPPQDQINYVKEKIT